MKTKATLLIFAIFSFLFSISTAQQLQLWNIDLTFCNSWIITNELDLITKAWEEVSICINITNTSQEDMSVNIDFLDATITQDAFSNRACNAADRPKTYFGNFMLDYDKTVNIKWNSTIKKTYKIQLPVWYKWLSHGCVAYNVIQPSWQENQSMLNIIVRKIKFIDIFVWATPIKSQIKIWSIKTTKDWKITNFQIWFKNIWNTTQNATISWTITNILGFKKQLKLDQNTVSIEPNKEIQIKTNNKDLILPTYKWLFTVNFEITNKPVFNFNISSWNNILKEVVLGGNFKASKIIFIANPYFYWILVIFLVLIYLAFFRKRKTIIISKKKH